MLSITLVATLIAGGALGLGGSLAAAQEKAKEADKATAAQRTDGQIEMDVVHALDAEAALKQDWITAGTVQGEVTLSGTSASETNRQLAESIAARVAGVTSVVNSLKVGNPQAAQDAQSAAEPQEEQSSPVSASNNNQQNATSDQRSQPQETPVQQEPAPANNGQEAQMTPRPSYRPVPMRPPLPVNQEYPLTPVTVMQGALIKVRTSEALDSKNAKEGTSMEFTVVRDVYAAGILAIPRGASIHGQVISAKKAGALGGRPELALKLQSLELGGLSYPLDSDTFQLRGPNKAGNTVNNAFGGAILGAIIGGVVGGGQGAAIGAGAGAVGGTAVSAATPGPGVWIPSEALIDFHLSSDLTVTPVNAQEAQRLAANAAPLRPERPTLYRRGPYGYPPPPRPGYYYRPY